MRKIVLVVALAAFSLAARGKSAPTRCVVTSNGERPYSGPCSFAPEGDGSFVIQPIGRHVFSGEITDVSVSLTGPGAAEVRGLTISGINSRWGSATRSRKDPACWDGEDFRICVYR